MSKLKLAAAIPAVALALSAVPALSETEILVNAVSSLNADNSAERIESVELLRTFSQEITAAACFLHYDVSPDEATDLLIEARDGFDLHLAALIHGDATLGILSGEHRKKTIVRLETISTEWATMRSAVDAILVNTDDEAAFAVIDEHDAILFDMADRLVAEIENEYANPAELVYADVVTMEVIGRMEAMSQQIAKNACKSWNGEASDALTALLTQEIGIYEASLDALLNGMPALGIAPAPTEEIRMLLTSVSDDWHEMRPYLDTILTGGDITPEIEAEFFHHVAEELHMLEKVEHAYAIFSKHVY